MAPDFLAGDARAMPFLGRFGLAILVGEGAFPLMKMDEMNFKIPRGAFRALRPGGKLIMTTLNGLCPLCRSIAAFKNEAGGPSSSTDHDFDPLTFRMRSRLTARDDQGHAVELDCDERWHVPSELSWLLKQAGLAEFGIFSAKLGAFSRTDILTPGDFEMLAVAVKP